MHHRTRCTRCTTAHTVSGGVRAFVCTCGQFITLDGSGPVSPPAAFMSDEEIGSRREPEAALMRHALAVRAMPADDAGTGTWPPPPDEMQDEQGRWQPPDADKTPQDGWRDESDAIACHAVKHGDTWYCQPCGLQWSDDDPEPPECAQGCTR
jgi:hypothetical protein